MGFATPLFRQIKVWITDYNVYYVINL